ncbi:MAG: peptidoglycan recognition family protein [Candidatus Pacebacteria bacterium]|nr:peptidoglycan recognition family protein [Candidatus Paceibacterota bacterium]
MKIINQLLNKKDFIDYLESKHFSRGVDKIILHHTSDSIESWNGESSILDYKKTYESKGWKSGPHLFIAPEGIYLFTDMNIQGVHANDGNKNSIGIEMVGNYDIFFPSGCIWENTELVLTSLLKKFNLEIKDIHFHRRYNAKKSCPGKAVTKKKIREMLKLC